MLIFPQIIDNKLDVFYLAGSQACYIKFLWGTGLLHITPQQIICADMKEIRNPYQHIYRRHDIVVFPI